MKRLKKGLVIFLAALLIGVAFVPAVSVSALENLVLAIDFADDYDSAQGHVEYKINDEAWVQVSADTDIQITEEVTSLLFKVVPEEFYEVNFDNGPHLTDGAGVAFEAGGEDTQAKRAQLTGDGYAVTLTDGLESVVLSQIAFRGGAASGRTTPVTIDITGPGLEYWNGDYPSRINFFINTPQGEHEESNIKWGGTDNLEWKGTPSIRPAPENHVTGVTGVRTKNPVEITYDYNGSGYVSIPVGISNASTKITSFKVNGQEFKNQCPQTDAQFLDALDGPRSVAFTITNVPYADHYDIVIVAEFDDLMGGFGWNYLPEETQSGDTREDCIAHGTLSFIKGEYNGMTFNSASEWNGYRHGAAGTQIFEWIDGDKNYKDEHDAWGSAAFPRGAIITFKLIPDEGYQLTSLFGDKDLEPQEDPGVYKITMTGGMNSHLQATFTEVGDVVNATAGAVKGGELSGMTNTHGEGTMKLNVEDTEINGDSRTGFEGRAEEEKAEIQEYIDINLANTIYKATDNPSDAWDRPVDELEEPARIKLELENSYEGKELVIIHEHNGQYEVIPVEFDGKSTISFETKSFSNYAIATADPEEEPGDQPGDEPGDEPGEGDEPGQDEQAGDEHYELKAGDDTLEFDDRKDADYSLVIVRAKSLTEEQLAAMGATREEADAMISMVEQAVPKEFLDLYVITIINNETGEETWGRQNLVLKLKKNSDMDGFENFRLVDASEIFDGGAAGAEIKGVEEEGYITFKLSEVGQFALVADKVKEETTPTEPSPVPTEPSPAPAPAPANTNTTPPTGDESNIMPWLLLALVTAATALYVKKKAK